MLARVLPSHSTPKLNNEPNNALSRNTFEGEKRSAMLKIAKLSEPIIKPNCTAEVRCPRAVSLRSKLKIRSLITPFPANQREVQQNWEITIMGSIRFKGFN